MEKITSSTSLEVGVSSIPTSVRYYSESNPTSGGSDAMPTEPRSDFNLEENDDSSQISTVELDKVGKVSDSAYPSVSWVRNTLRNSLYAPTHRPILDAFIIGSEAKGTATPDSDLDIGVIVQPIRGKTSLQLSEEYHSKFPTNASKPHWNNRRVDFQFFYPDDPELATYSKIPLSTTADILSQFPIHDVILYDHYKSPHSGGVMEPYKIESFNIALRQLGEDYMHSTNDMRVSIQKMKKDNPYIVWYSESDTQEKHYWWAPVEDFIDYYEHVEKPLDTTADILSQFPTEPVIGTIYTVKPNQMSALLYDHDPNDEFPTTITFEIVDFGTKAELSKKHAHVFIHVPYTNRSLFQTSLPNDSQLVFGLLRMYYADNELSWKYMALTIEELNYLFVPSSQKKIADIISNIPNFNISIGEIYTNKDITGGIKWEVLDIGTLKDIRYRHPFANQDRPWQEYKDNNTDFFVAIFNSENTYNPRDVIYIPIGLFSENFRLYKKAAIHRTADIINKMQYPIAIGTTWRHREYPYSIVTVLDVCTGKEAEEKFGMSIKELDNWENKYKYSIDSLDDMVVVYNASFNTSRPYAERLDVFMNTRQEQSTIKTADIIGLVGALPKEDIALLVRYGITSGAGWKLKWVRQGNPSKRPLRPETVNLIARAIEDGETEGNVGIVVWKLIVDTPVKQTSSKTADNSELEGEAYPSIVYGDYSQYPRYIKQSVKKYSELEGHYGFIDPNGEPYYDESGIDDHGAIAREIAEKEYNVDLSGTERWTQIKFLLDKGWLRTYFNNIMITDIRKSKNALIKYLRTLNPNTKVRVEYVNEDTGSIIGNQKGRMDFEGTPESVLEQIEFSQYSSIETTADIISIPTVGEKYIQPQQPSDSFYVIAVGRVADLKPSWGDATRYGSPAFSLWGMADKNAIVVIFERTRIHGLRWATIDEWQRIAWQLQKTSDIIGDIVNPSESLLGKEFMHDDPQAQVSWVVDMISPIEEVLPYVPGGALNIDNLRKLPSGTPVVRMHAPYEKDSWIFTPIYELYSDFVPVEEWEKKYNPPIKKADIVGEPQPEHPDLHIGQFVWHNLTFGKSSIVYIGTKLNALQKYPDSSLPSYALSKIGDFDIVIVTLGVDPQYVDGVTSILPLEYFNQFWVTKDPVPDWVSQQQHHLGGKTADIIQPDEKDVDISRLIYKDHRYAWVNQDRGGDIEPNPVKVIVTMPFDVEVTNGEHLRLEIGDTVTIIGIYPDYYEAVTKEGTHIYADYREMDGNTEPYQ